MEQNINYFNPVQVDAYAEERANKAFFKLKDYLEEKGGVTSPSAGYELMELAYKIRNVIIQNDTVGTFIETPGLSQQNDIVELERQILLHNIEYGLYTTALKRFEQGLPLVLEASRGFGPDKDFVQVMQIGLDRYPGNTVYPMGKTNHYGVADKDIRLCDMLLFEVNPRAKVYTTQKVYYTPQAELLSEKEYFEKTGVHHSYSGHIADMQEQGTLPRQVKVPSPKQQETSYMFGKQKPKSAKPAPQQSDGQDL